MINFGRVIEVDIVSSRRTIKIRNLRIFFDVQDQVGDEPAQGRFTIFNLNPKNRASIRFEKLKSLDRLGDTVILRAGYNGSVKEIYQGVIISAVNTKNGPDWITEILTSPEIARLIIAQLNIVVPYQAGTLKSTIFFDAMNSLNIPVNSQEKAKVIEILGAAKIKKAWTMFGSAMDVLNRLSGQWKEMINVRYYGNKARMLAPGESINSVPIKINSGSLIGPVEIIDGGVRFKTQLDGNLNLQKLISIDTQTVEDLTTSGQYVVQTANHRGDNRQGDFVTSVSCGFPNSEKGILRTGLR